LAALLVAGVASAAGPRTPSPSLPPSSTMTPELERKLDAALERFYAKDYATSARQLAAIFRALPDSELKRDVAQFHLAAALGHLGFGEAAVEHYFDVIVGRRAPDLVGRALGALDDLVRQSKLDENRVIDRVLFGNQFGDLPAETGQFVEYYQALGELRRGFSEWGTRRLEDLSRAGTFYGYRARYALGVERLAQGNGDGAEKMFAEVANGPGVPGPVRNDARLALARLYYERKDLPRAFEQYSLIDSPLPAQDVVLLEKAWTKVAGRDEQRALGMVIGLGAPVYSRLFAPERALVRAMALIRICQFRPAYVTVTEFRSHYAAPLARLREGKPADQDPSLRRAALIDPAVAPIARWRDRLAAEKARIGRIEDATLEHELGDLYAVKLAEADSWLQRVLPKALDRAAETLLATDEQMSILGYEVGVGLFKRIASAEGEPLAEPLEEADIPTGSERIYYRFSGEYWTDELHDYLVRARNRCVR
jgi:hypothetical protein